MKRSEVIELIKEHLYNLPQDKAYLWKYIEEEANSILDTIEEAGMLPPKNKKIYEREAELRMRGYITDHRMPDIYYHKWEKEDE